jgi:hypothetical protein
LATAAPEWGLESTLQSQRVSACRAQQFLDVRIARAYFSPTLPDEARCGHVLPIAQMGPNSLVLTQMIDHPPVAAEITQSIDGDETCWPVWPSLSRHRAAL